MRRPTVTRALALLAALTLTTLAGALHGQGLDRPMPAAWPAAHAWSDDMEHEYGEFVATIGRAVAAGRCAHLSNCLNDPRINPLYEPGMERLRFRADCADVAYILRAYFSYRHQLPFGFTREMVGHGHDARYLAEARPEGTRLWTEFRTPRDLIQGIGSMVHSGYFRTPAEVDDSDFYQAAINRAAIQPGTMFYDPNGHVLVVYEVRDNGDVMFFDGHPDNSMSHPRLNPRMVLGGARQGGGFKNWRPIAWVDGALVRTANRDIALYGAGAQYERSRYRVEGHETNYYDWVRALLVTPTVNAAPSPTAAVVPAHTPGRTNCALFDCEACLCATASESTHPRARTFRRARIV